MRKEVREYFKQLVEDVPTNNVSGGKIAGVGVGPQGEPGVSKKKKILPFMGYVRRKTPKVM